MLGRVKIFLLFVLIFVSKAHSMGVEAYSWGLAFIDSTSFEAKKRKAIEEHQLSAQNFTLVKTKSSDNLLVELGNLAVGPENNRFTKTSCLDEKLRFSHLLNLLLVGFEIVGLETRQVMVKENKKYPLGSECTQKFDIHLEKHIANTGTYLKDFSTKDISISCPLFTCL